MKLGQLSVYRAGKREEGYGGRVRGREEERQRQIGSMEIEGKERRGGSDRKRGRYLAKNFKWKHSHKMRRLLIQVRAR